MPRLRIRVELNRGGVGIPLHKLASVVEESQKFFHLLAEDVRIPKEGGEWLAFDLDNGSLNFTAEYVGAVTIEQVRAFYAAFDGATSLRRATIAQFTRITESIGQDEVIGFGLYQSDREAEPAEWRCLSKRDAFRIADEIRILQGAVGEAESATNLRTVIDSDRGAQLFKQRHDRGEVAGDQSKLSSFVRAVESNLARRISRLEDQVETHSGMIQDLRKASSTTEDSFRNLLSTVERFCGQATQQIEKLSQPLLVVPPVQSSAKTQPRWRIVAFGALVFIGLGAAAFVVWPTKRAETPGRQAAVGSRAPAETNPSKTNPSKTNPSKTNDVASPVAPVVAGSTGAKSTPSVPLDKSSSAGQQTAHVAGSGRTGNNAATSADPGALMQITLETHDDSAWVSMVDADGNALLARTLQPNETHNFELRKDVTLRTGNAGALQVRFNGTDIGPLGPSGKVREVEFGQGTFRILAPTVGHTSSVAR
jgi:hypothetical protein